MSHTEETPKPTQTPEAKNDPVADQADELEIVDAMKPSAAPASNNKPLRYGNRKKKAGESGPVITNLSSISEFEEEEIEMDDLPVKANAPEELIDTRRNPNESGDQESESRPRRQNRSRGERREKKPRARAPESETNNNAETEVQSETEEDDPKPNRPERFGTVKKPDSNPQVQEFRPSRDGRTAPKREVKREKVSASKPKMPKKQGILSKIIALFTGGEKEEESTRQDRENRDGKNRRRNNRSRRGPQNRASRDDRDGEGGGNNKRRRRRPRNRKPRQDGENGPRGENQGGGNKNGRRRSRRPRRQGQGSRPKQESAST